MTDSDAFVVDEFFIGNFEAIARLDFTLEIDVPAVNPHHFSQDGKRHFPGNRCLVQAGCDDALGKLDPPGQGTLDLECPE